MKGLIKKILPHTLFGRSLLILAIPILLIQIIATYFFFERHWSSMTTRLANAASGEISVMADEIERDSGPDRQRQIAFFAARNFSMLVGYEPGGKINPVSEPQQGLTVRTLSKAMSDQIRRPYTISAVIDDKKVNDRGVNVAVQLRDGVLHVFVPEGRLYSSSGYIFLLWVMGASLVLLAVAVIFMRNQIRPIRRLAVAAERFGKGMDVPASFKPEGAREVRQAAKAFIEMHERIRRQIQQRTAMLAGVSHDLRTPLTRMKLQVAMMENGPDVEALNTDISDMERMIDAYLDFARGEGGEQSVRTDLREMLERMAAGARRQGAKVELEMKDDLSLQLRPVAFERCLNNLVSNARKYAEHIWIAASRYEQGIVVTVDDNGPGVPENMFEEMFRPFVRGEPSRNPATGGVGLGLPIARDIVHAHGGEIWLEKSPRGGLRAVIQVPV
jgi:two-component system, OmpR family, osmolarity sensor histidine kinase EnvZ